MNRLPLDRAKKEIEDGIASITAALGDGTAPAPFFRIPGLGRSDVIEAYAEAKGLQIWSADFPADDWRPVSSQRVYDLAMQRLEAKGKGILLLHDIQARTVAALPRILQRPESPRLPHRPCRAGDAGPAGDADRSVRNGNCIRYRSRWRRHAGPKFRISPMPPTAALPAPDAGGFRLAQCGPGGPRAAARLARRLVVAAGDAGA